MCFALICFGYLVTITPSLLLQVVLSSEEEEEENEEDVVKDKEEEVLNTLPPEGDKATDRLETPESTYEQKSMPDFHSHITRLYTQVGSMIHILHYI